MNAKITTGARWALGGIYLIFGLNGFLHFLPQPPLPETALGYLGGLASAPYFFPVLKGTEVIASLLLLSGLAAPLALVILAPITIQIFLFHFFLTPGLQNSLLPLAMIALHLTSALAYWSLYQPLFTKDNALQSVRRAA
ncbi:MAG: acyltransferase [Bdellovibrionales bacterium]|nr:acyltransferase [Bdellovibrionales bacterium]